MKKQLTAPEASMLIAGAGIGTGILTLPYAISRIGFFGTLTALFAAVCFSFLLYCLVADLTLRSAHSAELTGILDEHLFSERKHPVISVLFTILLVVVLIENLIVYILCASDLITALTGLSASLSRIAFTLAASLIVPFGIRSVGIGEKISVSVMAVVIILLTVLATFHKQQSLSFTFGASSGILAVYGLFMFSFSAIFAVIQAANALGDHRHLRPVLLSGLLLNASLTLLFSVAAITGSIVVTPVATIGLAESLGIPAVRVICAVFILLAMFTSFWSGSLMFCAVIERCLHTSHAVSFAVVTVPTTLIAVVLPLSLLDYVQIGAGALSVMILLALIPAYFHAVRNSNREPLLGAFGKSRLLAVTACAATLLMAVSSLLSVG